MILRYGLQSWLQRLNIHDGSDHELHYRPQCLPDRQGARRVSWAQLCSIHVILSPSSTPGQRFEYKPELRIGQQHFCR